MQIGNKRRGKNGRGGRGIEIKRKRREVERDAKRGKDFKREEKRKELVG